MVIRSSNSVEFYLYREVQLYRICKEYFKSTLNCTHTTPMQYIDRRPYRGQLEKEGLKLNMVF